jgi:hypothetical protein
VVAEQINPPALDLQHGDRPMALLGDLHQRRVGLHADVTKVTPLVAVRDRNGPVGDRGGLQSALGGGVREVGRDDDALMPEAARRPLQRFCALAAPRARRNTPALSGASWRAGRATPRTTGMRCRPAVSLPWGFVI